MHPCASLSNTPHFNTQVELPSLSVWTLPGVWHGVTDFGCYNDGAAALGGGGLAGAEAKDEMLDRVRVLCEECDSMQGKSRSRKGKSYGRELSDCCAVLLGLDVPYMAFESAHVPHLPCATFRVPSLCG